MNKYYILKLKNNIHAMWDDGHFNTVFEPSEYSLVNGGDGAIIAESINNKMIDIITGLEIVDSNTFKSAMLSYYDKTEIPMTMVIYLLSKYKRKNIINYKKCIIDIINYNAINYNDYSEIDECIDMNYISKFKKRAKRFIPIIK
ncbi:MAG: hypothetical protein MR835_04405 [Erysipelotrichaceae bacterium]|nr:hypothetical protein [Erysipelotrichaceae bacterium]MDY3933973.1 hypothetical protein [Bacilli bacterium]